MAFFVLSLPMVHNSLLSIIVPVYKVESTLDACLESIVGQSFTDYQLILVDDGSPDKCPVMCDEWAGRDSRIRVVHKANGGLSDARNAGIDAATGRYLMFVDSDDELADDTLEPLMTIVAEHPEIDILEFPVSKITVDGQGNEHSAVTSFGGADNGIAQTYTDMRDYWLNGRAYEHSYAWNKLYRKSLFDDVRFPVGRVFEDIHTLPQLLRHVKMLATTNAGMYLYRYNPRGITGTAGGREFAMFLDSHITVLRDLFAAPDGRLVIPPTTDANRYYMRVVDIQLLLSEYTGENPILPQCRVALAGLSAVHKAKAVLINTIGLSLLCKINHKLRKTFHRKK